jgi:hypothetical protein
MKRMLASGLTVLLMGLLLWSGTRRAPAPVSVGGEANDGSSTAEARVQGLLQSASQGDVAGYLDAFAGPLRARLEREVNERGRAAFGQDLRSASQSRKGHAVFAGEPDGPGSARVIVETVYVDRNERQTYRLEQNGVDWFVAEVETVKSGQPIAKFGAPASYIAPEGVPVQGGTAVETDEGGPP